MSESASTSTLITGVGILVLALIHVIAGKLHVLKVIPRSRWLSLGSGASVAYVFLHLLPELAASQKALDKHLSRELLWIEHHIYLLSLLGVTVFYGLERLVVTSKAQRTAENHSDQTSEPVFWVHIGSFAVYNLLIGYLSFHLEEPSLRSTIIFFIAMGLHFFVNDYGLSEHHKDAYRNRGRWIVSAGVAAGGVLGSVVQISETLIFSLIGFLAGGVILNVLKEELPEERESRFGAFLLGVVGYSVILMLR